MTKTKLKTQDKVAFVVGKDYRNGPYGHLPWRCILSNDSYAVLASVNGEEVGRSVRTVYLNTFYAKKWVPWEGSVGKITGFVPVFEHNKTKRLSFGYVCVNKATATLSVKPGVHWRRLPDYRKVAIVEVQYDPNGSNKGADWI